MALNTKIKIQESLKVLLKNKKVEEITISEVIKESKISRSTFYSHYKNINGIIIEIIDDIFKHVLSSNLNKEKHHDFSNINIFSFKHIITHLFCHFKEEKEFILNMLDNHNIIFEEKYIKSIRELSKNLFDYDLIKKNNIPQNIYLETVVYSLCGLLNKSLRQKEYSSEEYTEFFFRLFGN